MEYYDKVFVLCNDEGRNVVLLLRKLRDQNGNHCISHENRRHMLTPEKVMRIVIEYAKLEHLPS